MRRADDGSQDLDLYDSPIGKRFKQASSTKQLLSSLQPRKPHRHILKTLFASNDLKMKPVEKYKVPLDTSLSKSVPRKKTLFKVSDTKVIRLPDLQLLELQKLSQSIDKDRCTSKQKHTRNHDVMRMFYRT